MIISGTGCRIVRHLILATALFLQAVITWADPAELAILDGARKMLEAQQDDGNYRLVTGSIKKVNNQWRAEKQQNLTGRVTRETYELQSSVTFSHAKRKMLDYFVGRQGYRRVFTCDGLDCGSSSGWANEFLNVKQLFGLDNYQNYSVWEMTGQRKGYVVLYLVQRGNKRIYLQRDVIDLAGEQPGQVDVREIEQTLTRIGYYRVPGFELDASGAPRLSAAGLESLKSFLARSGDAHWRLVGHDYSNAGPEAEQEKSLLYAAFVIQQLRDAEAPVDRITAHGVGSLAPESAPGMPRVVLVPGSMKSN